MAEVMNACSPEVLAEQLGPGVSVETIYGDRVVPFTVDVVGMRWIAVRGEGTKRFPDPGFAILGQHLENGKTMSVSRSLQELSDHGARIVPAE